MQRVITENPFAPRCWCEGCAGLTKLWERDPRTARGGFWRCRTVKNKKDQKLRAKAKQKGLCPTCQREEAMMGSSLCESCRNRASIRSAEKGIERYEIELESLDGLRKEDQWQIRNLSPAK